ncbi:hypothetical protein CANARDRAFT_29802 [[Candida] arabinofermentans NRRL YB-2248]|uniref:Uncharacterized protein n=1 Tax=[Candida] arabinofermentans NRRL YB-2248 TaxID=983967 RepID=A0A1E4SVP2_9ASCO|nr:hypothetical protein CANARDRAFT_29802 [[Candida] arabinofermentans NRRL YB-2248]
MDANGYIYIIDIINCSIYKKFENNLNDFKGDLNDLFDELIQPYQTIESLPMWCNVYIKSGRLIVTLQESTYTNCEIYIDELKLNYPELQVDEIDNDQRLNLGKIVIKSLFNEFYKYEFEESKFNQKKLSMPDLQQQQQPLTDRKQSNASSSSELEKPKRKLFGRSRVPSTSSQTTTPIIQESKSHQITQDELISSLKTTNDLLKYIHGGLITTPFTPSHLKSGKDTDDPITTIPTIKLNQDVLIIINENLKKYGQDTKAIYQTTSSELIKNESNISLFENLLPLWVSKSLLINVHPLKDTAKLGFVLIPSESIKVRFQQDTSKLNANNLLRVNKIIEFILDKFPSSEKESEDKCKDIHLDIYCKGEKLDLNMTLITIKNRIWKSSNDIELVYDLATTTPSD